MNVINSWKRWLVMLVGGLALVGCQTTPPPTVTYYGTIDAIQLIPADKSGPVNVGSVIGGIAGGVIGYQFGGGVGKGLLTAAGAGLGALAGNAIQRSTERDQWRITVRLDNGGTLNVTEVDQQEFRVGDRVRVVNNRVYRT